MRHAPLLAAVATSLALLVAMRCELVIAREPLNDLALHVPLSDRLSEALRSGENPLDCWVSEWTLGHPIPRTYQPLAPLLVALAHVALGGLASLASVFSVIHWLLIGLLPLSVFAGARLLGLRPSASVAAAVVSPLLSTDLLFGIELGSTAWRGSGLFTQSLAQVLLPLALGFGFRRIRGGARLWPAALLLALTFAAHFVYGLIGALSLVLAAALPRPPQGRADAGADDVPGAAARVLRLASLGLATFALSAWLLVPLLLDRAFINHSRWEADWKWDSFGLPKVARLLVTGDLLDFGRFPCLTLLALLGLGAVLGRVVLRRGGDSERFVLAGSALWLALLCGRPAWDGLFDLLGMGDVPLHRLIGGTHLFLMLLAAIGLAFLAGLPRLIASLVPASADRPPHPAILPGLGALVVLLALAPALVERGAFIRTGERWGLETIAMTDLERGDIDAAVALCRERGGRAWSGSAGGWGKDFGVKWTPMHAFLSRGRVPQVSFLFHAMALTSDVMVRFDETNPAHFRLFDVRTALAPPDREYGSFATEIARFGRFRAFDVPGGGAFDVVDVAGARRCDRRSFFDVVDPWLVSDGPAQRRHLALDLGGRHPEDGFTSLAASEPLPDGEPASPGRVISEEREGERYRARVSVEAERAWVMLKATWHPRWRARVDGEIAPTSHLTPGFVAVRVPRGEHEVAFAYEPGGLKLALLLGAGLALMLGIVAERRPLRLDERIAPALHRAAARLAASPRVREAAGVTGLALLAGMPLLLPGMGSGHDAIAYLPRVVEAHENFRAGILLPRWAPDLSAGHGQPFFLYTPPLPAWLAGIPHGLGASPERAVNLAAFAVLLAGILAMRRAAAEIASPRASWVAAAAFALAPYVMTDLHVRAAFAESTALLLAPVALLGLLRHARTGSPRDLAIAAAGTALVGLSHHASALMLCPLLIALAIGHGIARRRASDAVVQAGAVAAGVLTAGCAWLPGLLEAPLVRLHEATEGYFHWRMHLVEPWQLLWSPWGFGLSDEGSGDGMSFRLGPLHLALAAAALALIEVRARRGDGAAPAREPRARIVLLVAGVALAGALMTRPFGFAWEWIPLLPSVQFPWRLSGVVTLMLVLLAAHASDLLAERLPSRAGPWLARALIAAFVLMGYPLARPAQRTHADPLEWTPEEIARRGAVATSVEELEPLGVLERASWVPGLVASAPDDLPIDVRRESPERLLIELPPSSVAGDVVLRLHDFRGWTLRGSAPGISKLEPEAMTSRLRLRVEPSASARSAELVLERTRVQRAGLALSAIGLAGIAGLALLGRPARRAGATLARPGGGDCDGDESAELR